MLAGRRAVLAVSLTPLGLLAAACGSSSSGGSPVVASAQPPMCTQVADVLGDGPDPSVDPVGYAEAQVGPLADLHPTNPALKSAITSLDAAYRVEFHHGVTRASNQQVKAALKQVTTVCPGAAS